LHAENIAWQYAWTANPASLAATVGTGQVAFNAQSNSTSSSAGTPLGILAASVQFTSTASPPPGTSDSFTNVAEALTVNLTDGASGNAGSLTFNGLLNGNLWSTGNSLALSFSNPTQSLTLGSHVYSVSLVPVLTEFEPGVGFVFGLVTASDVQQTPEPSTLLLATLSLPLAGLAAWRRSRRLKAPCVG
jgi:hypothetical protein